MCRHVADPRYSEHAHVGAPSQCGQSKGESVHPQSVGAQVSIEQPMSEAHPVSLRHPLSEAHPMSAEPKLSVHVQLEVSWCDWSYISVPYGLPTISTKSLTIGNPFVFTVCIGSFDGNAFEPASKSQLKMLIQISPMDAAAPRRGAGSSGWTEWRSMIRSVENATGTRSPNESPDAVYNDLSCVTVGSRAVVASVDVTRG